MKKGDLASDANLRKIQSIIFAMGLLVLYSFYVKLPHFLRTPNIMMLRKELGRLYGSKDF